MSTEDELKKAGVTILPPKTPEQPESQIIIERLRALGYEFKLNSCMDMIEVNGHPMSDILAAEIRMRLRDVGLAKKLAAAEDAYIAEAKKNAYHAVRDYLDALSWDGDDHIGALAAHLTSSDPPIVYRDGRTAAMPYIYLYRWLIGAVAKVYTGAQNPMLVWDGGQGIGKSTLAKWLCPLTDYFLEGPISVADKDSDIRLISQWIWEVAELDATTRKADQSALKSFITKEVVTVRKAYGRHDIKKPAMCSLIGTVNNTSGFLADETGSRRFMITRLDRIDRRYQKLDIHQIWAHAKARYFDGEPWQLVGEEAQAQGKQNQRYEVESVLSDWLDRAFEFGEFDEQYSIADVLRALDMDGVKVSGSERGQSMEIGRLLKMKRCRKLELDYGNRWVGLHMKPR